MNTDRVINDYILVCAKRRLDRVERQSTLKLLEYFGNELATHDDYQLHITGSISECALNASDIDKMLPSKSFAACDGHCTVAERCESSPGYVRLRVENVQALIPASIANCVVNWRRRSYIGSLRYVEMNSERISPNAAVIQASGISDSDPKIRRHGPAVERQALSEIHMKNDNVFCLRAVSWPLNAWDHLETFRSMKIPVFVVPVSHPKSESPELEWRWSFSLIEREIIKSLTEEENVAYGILKSLKSEIFKEPEGVSTLLSSYFIKTAYFWLLQKLRNEHKKPATIVEYIEKLADLLLSYYRSGILPSFFVKDYNLIDSLTEIERITVIDRLLYLQASLPWSLLSLKDIGFFIYTRHEKDKLSEMTGVDISSSEQQFWDTVREKSCIERVLEEITAFINPDPANKHTQTSVRNRLRNELQNFLDPSLADIYPVPKKPQQVRSALAACIANIDDIVDAAYTQCFRCVLRRAIANSYFFEIATTAACDVSERLRQLAEETYEECLHLVLPGGFDDLELSGRAALSFFHYCCGDARRCAEVLRPCLYQLRDRDDWLEVCGSAVVQELSRDHHATMLQDVDHHLYKYVARLAAGGSVFVSSAALLFYLSISTPAFGGEDGEEWTTRLQQLEEYLATIASGGLLFQHLNSSCSELRRLATIKHRQLTATSSAHC